uniref:Uncharacterized protein n=1 Tax=Arundo donax TaxID=35708 RepID=A0A0A8Z6Q9_ARUDO
MPMKKARILRVSSRQSFQNLPLPSRSMG